MTRIFSDPHLAIKSSKHVAMMTKEPVIVDYIRYGSSSYEFRIRPKKEVLPAATLAECSESRRSWKIKVLDFKFLKEWDSLNN